MRETGVPTQGIDTWIIQTAYGHEITDDIRMVCPDLPIEAFQNSIPPFSGFMDRQ